MPTLHLRPWRCPASGRLRDLSPDSPIPEPSLKLGLVQSCLSKEAVVLHDSTLAKRLAKAWRLELLNQVSDSHIDSWRFTFVVKPSRI